MSPFRFVGAAKYLILYDVGQEIDLKAAELLLTSSKRQQFRLSRPAKSVAIAEAPLIVNAPALQLDDEGLGHLFFNPTAKFWHFGAICLSFTVELPDGTPLKQLTYLAEQIENSNELKQKSLKLAEELLKTIGKAVRQPFVSQRFEDHLVFIHRPDNFDQTRETLSQLLTADEFAQLIMTDSSLLPSAAGFESLQAQVIKYSRNDFVLVDWNSSFICSEGDSDDIVEILEFALCQLLELQYYDQLLDTKLSQLYRTMLEQKSSLLRSPYAQVAHEAALLFIETSEVVEKIENSLKVTGDFYYARLYRTAVERLRVRDWQQLVAKKLKSLNDVALLLQNEVHAKRTLVLEATIVILIAIEVIPFLYKSLLS